MRRPARAALPALFLVTFFAIVAIAIVREQLEEVPHVPYDLAEYAAVTSADLGTDTLFDDPLTLTVTLRTRTPGSARFIVVGDGGQDEDAGKRALARGMREACQRRPCDFVLFTGDNVYYDGIDTFTAAPLEDSIPDFDLRSEFLQDLPPDRAGRLAARVRAAAGRVAAACGRARGGRAREAWGSPLDSSAAEAYRRHFEPKFERTFGWLAEEGIPAFVLLGNHDWRSPFGAECEIGYSLRAGTAWKMPYYFYRVRLMDSGRGGSLADLLALYSAPPHGSLAGENYAWIGPRQRAWLGEALRRSDAPWILAAEHHPVWSAGGHTLLELRSFHADLLAAMRESGRTADLLIAGHNHWLESVAVSVGGRPALQVVSGSLSKAAFGRMLPRLYPFFNLLALNAPWRSSMRQELDTDPDEFLRSNRSMLRRGYVVVDLGPRQARLEYAGVDGLYFSEAFVRGEGLRAASPEEESESRPRAREVVPGRP